MNRIRTRDGRRGRRRSQAFLAAALVLVVLGALTACTGMPPGGVTSPDPSPLASEPSPQPSDAAPSIAPTATPSRDPEPTATPSRDPDPTAPPAPDLAPGFTMTGAPDGGDETAGEAAVLLRDGHVLVLGECAPDAELYDIATGTFTATGAMTRQRFGKTVTLLSDGRVLVAGGYECTSSGDGGVLASAEIYDPATGTFEPTGDMHDAREFHTATLLDDGRVLVTGGYSGSGATAGAISLASVRTAETSRSVLSTAEVFDPVSDTFRTVGSMSTFRDHHTATLLSDGKALIIGGGGEAYPSSTSADLYDPATDTFVPTGSMREGRWLHTASLLRDGRVLVLGGRSPEDSVYGTAEMYDPRTRTFSSAGTMTEARQLHTATVLPDGRVFIAGGMWQDGLDVRALSETEMFDPGAATFASIGSMGDPRMGHTATLLPDGRVLIVGGSDIGQSGTLPVGSAVLYSP